MIKYIAVILIITFVTFLILRDKQAVSASAEAVIMAPIEKIWNLHTNVAEWNNWNNEIESMQVDGSVGLGTTFIWKAGGITIESTIAEYAPLHKIAWNGKTLGITAYHVWTFTETEAGVRVHTEERFTGFLAWLLPGTMRSQIEKALTHGVSALKTTAEKM